MTVRVIKVKGEQLSILSYGEEEQLITGTATGETGTAGIFKVKGTYLYWIDHDGNERRKEGTATGETGTAGQIKIKGDYLYYIDDNGDERYVSAITLYEYYNTGDDTAGYFYDTFWVAQTFTPAVSHQITSVKLKLYRVNFFGTITIGIRATSGGEPTGGDLTSGTYDGSLVTTDPAGAWYTIDLSAYLLSASTQYAIVARTDIGDLTSCVYWRIDATSPTYTGGQALTSDDSGSTWTQYSGVDCMFEEWG